MPKSLYIYKIQPVRQEMVSKGRTPEEDQIVGAHFTYLERLTKQGVVLLAGRTLTDDYAGFGIIIFGAESQQAAEKIVLNDPAVAQRVMRAELYPFRASLVGQPIPPAE
ncbi:MAG TPA: YciI family protein [Anaerolineales bacterium]|nr:YciI family protein [Anaerolineales bacterium]